MHFIQHVPVCHFIIHLFIPYYTAPTVHCQSYKNNYFNIRHVLNEQLNHSLEFSAPMSFKFVTNINIALPRYKVISSRFSMTKLFFFL